MYGGKKKGVGKERERCTTHTMHTEYMGSYIATHL